jgi:hypothetical protein
MMVVRCKVVKLELRDGVRRGRKERREDLYMVRTTSG